MVKSLSRAGAERITAARPFGDVQDVARRAQRSGLFKRERRIVLGARLMGVTGEVQREGEVVHLTPASSKTERPCSGVSGLSWDFC